MNAPEQIPLPRFVQIEPVGRCNLRCTMCSIQYRHPDDFHGKALLPYRQFCQLLDQFSDIDELHLQGLGEPLMHPDFFRMVAYAVGKGYFVSTNTNLTLLTPARAQLCVTSGLGAVHVSIDGASAPVYEKIRVGASFPKVIRNLGRLMASRRALGTERLQVRIVTVAMRENLHELADIVRLAHRHGVGAVFVQHLSHDFAEETLPAVYRPMREFVARQTLLGEDPARVHQHFGEARAAAAALRIDLRLPPVERRGPDARPRGCDWPVRGAYLTYEGDALPCCMVSTADRFRLGNMVQGGVAGVWNGAPYRNLRRELADGEPPEICRTCALYNRTF